MSILAGKGLSKEEVNYRQHEQCKTCMHFYPMNSCDIVDGNISSDAVCDKWEMKPRDNGKDAEFYMEEYKKKNA
jgi:hypothetical protein